MQTGWSQAQVPHLDSSLFVILQKYCYTSIRNETMLLYASICILLRHKGASYSCTIIMKCCSTLHINLEKHIIQIFENKN